MAITVNSIKEAWEAADKIFPTDYIKDNEASEKAGYDIFKSTIFANDSWISDLGTSLEVNIDKGNYCDTVRINIEQKPAITEINRITADSVRSCCIKHSLYTNGSCRDYDFMLNYADTQDYSLEMLYDLAEDICKHSDSQTITNVMHILRKDAVITIYEIDGSDEQ